ncbi:hypothetical protein [Gordonibacter urolithinfaciens]|nr:hypothetical protein [Gordonibacter urolithinfaciens]
MDKFLVCGTMLVEGFPQFAIRRFSDTSEESGLEGGRFHAIASDFVQAVG